MSNPLAARDQKEGNEGVVRVGSDAFRQAVLADLSQASRLLFLIETEMHARQPGWLESMRAAGFFKAADFDVSAPSKSPLMTYREQQPYARLAWLMTRPNTPAEPGSAVAQRLQWHPQMQAAFRAIVDDYLLDAQDQGYQPAGSLYVANAALLLSCACAGGDIESARRILKRYPESLNTPVSVALLHTEHQHRANSDSSLVYGFRYPEFDPDHQAVMSPALLAAHHNRIEMLQCLKEFDFDPLASLHWKRTTNFPPDAVRFTDPNSMPTQSRNFADLICNSTPTARHWLPQTTEFFLEAFMACDEERRIEAGQSELTKALEWLVNDRGGQALREPFVRSGFLASRSDEILHDVVQLGDMYLLEALRHEFDWQNLAAVCFPVVTAVQRGDTPPGKATPEEVALTLVRWCVEDGHADLLVKPFRRNAGSSLIHRLAQYESTTPRLMMEIIGHGADPAAADDLGRTPVMIADSVGNLAVATFLRSFIARREMDALFDSGVLDEVDPPASKYPRMTP